MALNFELCVFRFVFIEIPPVFELNYSLGAGLVFGVHYIFNAWVGREFQEEVYTPTETTGQVVGIPVFDMESVLSKCCDRHIELLHMDIQGAELPFILSMQNAVKNQLVRFIMVSTHHSSISGSKTTHVDCLEAIRELGGNILVEHDVIESFSGDGLILASFMAVDRLLFFPEISRNKAECSLFKSS